MARFYTLNYSNYLQTCWDSSIFKGSDTFKSTQGLWVTDEWDPADKQSVIKTEKI